MKTKDQLINCFKEIAEKYGVGFKVSGDEVKLYIHFNADFVWHTYSLLLRWESNTKGGLNWWEDWVFDGKHHIIGPGYPSHAIHVQKPISEEELIAMAEKYIAEYIADYKQYEHRI